MPNSYTITVTAPATVSTHINVIAQSADQANDMALVRARHPDAIWELDDASNCSDMYLPDPDAAEHEAEAYTAPIKPMGDVILVSHGNETAIVLRTQKQYVLLNSANTTYIEELEDEARTLAHSLGTEIRKIEAQRSLPPGQWHEVTGWMNRNSDQVICQLWSNLKSQHGLPDFDLTQIGEIENPQIQAWAVHLLDRWEQDTGQVMP